MSVITLTDGGANWCFGSTMGDDGKSNIQHGSTPVIKVGKKSYTTKDNDRFYRSRSEEHTSELQSRLHLVCRLLLEKKKHIIKIHNAI